jgi:hypothetical protein
MLPTAEELPEILVDLAVPHEDIDPLVAGLPDARRNPHTWTVLRQCVELVLDENTPTLPPAPDDDTYFYVYVYLALLPHVRAVHEKHRIPADVSRLTLTDLGRAMAVYRYRHGVGGFESVNWLTLHFRGLLYQLGRLQFERIRLGERTGAAVEAAGLPYRAGDPALSVHVPSFLGPLSPAACDAALARAKDFFPRHFPDERPAVAVCHSWLLDPQLGDYLPADSNILRFQRRFRLVRELDDDDEVILRFVFGRTGASLDELPQRSTLERAVVGHLRRGGHWRGGAGWFPLRW